MAQLSNIPLFGLVHKVDINVYSGDSDDGAGGIVPKTEIEIAKNLRCRITLHDGTNKLLPQGLAGPGKFHALCIPCSKIAEDQIVTVSDSNTTVVCPAGNYRIVWTKQQIDHTGGLHHTSFIMEKLNA